MNNNKDENVKNSPNIKPGSTSIESGHGLVDKSKGQVVTPDDDNNDIAKEEQKKRGQLPLHDEPIGGA